MDTLAKICININVNTLAQSHNAIVKFNLAKKVTSKLDDLIHLEYNDKIFQDIIVC